MRLFLPRNVPSEAGAAATACLVRVSNDSSCCQYKRDKFALDNAVPQVLTWLDVAIVFGPQAPVVVVLVALTLWTSRWTHRLLLSPAFGARETRREQSKRGSLPSSGGAGYLWWEL